jgi:alanine racemase
MEHRPTHITVDLDVLRANLDALQRLVAPAAVMPVLKANAYGHGLIEVAAALDVDIVGVAFIEEAIALREAGIECDILVMGTPSVRQLDQFSRYDAIATATEPAHITALSAGRVHLKIDSGMGRAGARPESMQALVEALDATPGVSVEAVYTHFASADETDLSSSMDQLSRFNAAVADLANGGVAAPRLHAANSAALLRIPEARFDLVRAGICLYGVPPSDVVALPEGIHPALDWGSEVTFVKHLEPGDSVGYGSTWTATGPTTVAGVPVGYGDGFSRALSNHGSVLIAGTHCRVIGRVSMDQISVDVTGLVVAPGDPVVLIGPETSAADMADDTGTIPYEVLTSLSERVPRLYRGVGA